MGVPVKSPYLPIGYQHQRQGTHLQDGQIAGQEDTLHVHLDGKVLQRGVQVDVRQAEGEGQTGKGHKNRNSQQTTQTGLCRSH